MRVVSLVVLCASLSLAQSPEVEAGRQQYSANCANCHGASGDLIVGVDLGHNKFRRASTDDDLAGIITKGIPGTGMPPANMSRPQALTIVAYLRSLAPTATAGDTGKGRALFEAKGCTGCHRILGTGSRTGPDLSEIGSFRKPAELEQSILDPDASIEPDNRTFKAVTKDGSAITGRVINEDGFTVQVLDSKERLLSLTKSDLKESSFATKSGMPSFKDRLTPEELTDLVAYLTTLKRMDSK